MKSSVNITAKKRVVKKWHRGQRWIAEDSAITEAAGGERSMRDWKRSGFHKLTQGDGGVFDFVGTPES